MDIYRKPEFEKDAADVAFQLAQRFGIPVRAEERRIGIILGAGWGDALSLSRDRSVSLVHKTGEPSLHHFEGLRPLKHHERVVVHDLVAGRSAFVLFGRVHMNEAVAHPEYKFLARLQVESLLQLGVTTLVLTSAAVNLQPWKVAAGDIIAADGFSFLAHGPNMPLDADEPQAPWRSLDTELRGLAVSVGRWLDLRVHEGGLTMIRGPLGEISKYDIVPLRRTGALAAVTSIIPEACIATLYPGTKVLALSRVSDDGSDPSSDKEKKKLGTLLTNIIAQLP